MLTFSPEPAGEGSYLDSDRVLKLSIEVCRGTDCRGYVLPSANVGLRPFCETHETL